MSAAYDPSPNARFQPELAESVLRAAASADEDAPAVEAARLAYLRVEDSEVRAFDWRRRWRWRDLAHRDRSTTPAPMARATARCAPMGSPCSHFEARNPTA